jgi:hypothetical protein
MTTTISNPKNARAYSLEEVPAAGNEESRYLVGQTSEGWSVSRRVDAVANAYTKLVAERKAEAPSIAPEFKEVELFYVGLTADGSYVKVPRGKVRAQPTKEATRSGKFTRRKETGGALLDKAFLGEVDVRDEALWSALHALCEAEAPTGRVLRDLNDAVAELCLLRAGIVNIDRRSLPHEQLR